MGQTYEAVVIGSGFGGAISGRRIAGLHERLRGNGLQGSRGYLEGIRAAASATPLTIPWTLTS